MDGKLRADTYCRIYTSRDYQGNASFAMFYTFKVYSIRARLFTVR